MAPAQLAPLDQPPGSDVSAPAPTPGPGALDALFAGVVLALAFLLASTPARNSNLWLHLASGRALVQGQSPRGTDPFASTTLGVFWVNHGWLSDVALYELYELGGGKALVVAKSVLATVLAGLFFCFRRRGTRMGMVAFAAAVAVLALGPWLLLQPSLLSSLGVVLTLYLLERPSLVGQARRLSPKLTGQARRLPHEDSRVERERSARWLLVPLFVLWANLDAWFLLGPVLVALYALGEALRHLLRPLRRGLESTPPQGRGEIRALALLAGAGMAACLLTPYHYHLFAWPTPLGLSRAEQVWMCDPLGLGLIVSPFAARFPTAPAFASPGGWAYCLLLAAGAASFGLRGRALHPGRLLVWLALAALSLYQARAIPFFAVAAGPVLALNVQEWARRGKEEGGRMKDESDNGPSGSSFILHPSSFQRRLEAAGRGVGVLAGLCLLVLAWPGWLQPTPYQPRGWAVDTDDSLVRLARRLESWPADQKFRPDRFALTFSPEAAHYLAWFCPAEKGFLDSRWPLFDRVAGDFVQMRRCLLRSEGAGPDPELASLLEAHRIDRIILHDPDWERTIRAYRCLLQAGQEWELLALEGTSALFGRRSGAASPSPWKAFDHRRAAYRPEPDRRAPLDAPRPPQPPGLFDPFYRARDDRSPDRAEAALHLIYFDLRAERMRADLGRLWLLAQATGLAGSGPRSEPVGTASALAVRLYLTPLHPLAESRIEDRGSRRGADDPRSSILDLQSSMAAGFMMSRDQGPAEALLLSVRAARRALAANPEDAGAFLLLGEAYLRLARQTREQSWQAALPELALFRHTQALTALEQAILLRPDFYEAHDLLAQLYSEGAQLDRTLDHLRALLRIARQEAKKRGSDARLAADRQLAIQTDLETVETLVRRSQEVYDANSQDKSDPTAVVVRARLAMRHGLSRKALEMLLQSDPVIFGKSGALLQLDLMLGAGRAFEVHAWLKPEDETVLGFAPYHSLQARAGAACGDYAAADLELDKLSDQLRLVGISRERIVPVRTAVALRAGDAVLARPVFGAGPVGWAGPLYLQLEALTPLGGPANLLRQEADARVLRGLLALESGAVEKASQHFRAALAVWGSDRQAATGAGLDFPARPIGQHALGLLAETAP